MITHVVVKKITRREINLPISRKLSSNFPFKITQTPLLLPSVVPLITNSIHTAMAKNTRPPVPHRRTQFYFNAAPVRIFSLASLLIRFILRIINRKLLSFFFHPLSLTPSDRSSGVCERKADDGSVRCRYIKIEYGNFRAVAADWIFSQAPAVRTRLRR